MKKILIAIDYNPCAQKIAETGFEYAKAMNAEVCIAHAIADVAAYSMDYSPIMGFTGFDADVHFKNSADQQIEATRFLNAVVKYLGDDRIQIKVLDGKTAEAILDYAGDCKADLIVIGAQSHNGFEKIIMGDVAGNILKHSAIPVLVIPTDKDESIKINAEKKNTYQYVAG